MENPHTNPTMAELVRLAWPSLTNSHKQMADYLIAHPLKVAIMPIDGFAAATGVSLATANRFARALGFKSYSQFRAAAIHDFESALAPISKLSKQRAHFLSDTEVFFASLEESQRNMNLTSQSLDVKSCEMAVKAILEAKRIYILSFGSSSWLGGFLSSRLNYFCDDVQPLASIEGSGHTAKVLRQMKPSDLLICMMFPRYLSDAISTVRRIHEAGIPILALTDRPTSPLASMATTVLYAHVDSQYFSSSGTGILGLIEALVSAVAHRAKDVVQAASQLTEDMLPLLHQNMPKSSSSAVTSPIVPPKKPQIIDNNKNSSLNPL